MQSLHQLIAILDGNQLTMAANEMRELLDMFNDSLNSTKDDIEKQMIQNIKTRNFSANHVLEDLLAQIERMQNGEPMIAIPEPVASTEESTGISRPRKTPPRAVVINGKYVDLPSNTWVTCVRITNEILSAMQPSKFKQYADKVNAEKRKTLFYSSNQHKDGHYLPAVSLYVTTSLDADGTLFRFKQMEEFFNIPIVIELVTGARMNTEGMMIEESGAICEGLWIQHAKYGVGLCTNVEQSGEKVLCSIKFGNELKKFELIDGKSTHLEIVPPPNNQIPNGLYYYQTRYGDATLEVCDDSYILKSGSMIATVCTESASDAIRNLHSELVLDAQGILQQDTRITSVSLAAGLVSGHSTNGWDAWKNAQGQPISIYRNNKE